MDPGLALSYGVPYVHLAAFAIDVDRVRDAIEEDERPEMLALPMAWEVFLTALHLDARFDPEEDPDRTLLEELCQSLLEEGSDEPRLGQQIGFAIHELMAREFWPPHWRPLFRRWKQQGAIPELDPCWEDLRTWAGKLSQLCLDFPLDPPMLDSTREALEALAVLR